MLPIERYAVTRLRPAKFTPPAAIAAFMLLFGQSDSRPNAGAELLFAAGASVTRIGLSHVSVVTLLRKNDPSYASRAKPRLLPNSSDLPRAVVRGSIGTARSRVAGVPPMPKLPAQGCAP